jgi:hypothetical protein
LEQFVLDPELLPFQIGDRILVWKRMAAFLVDRPFEVGMPLPQRLDAILYRHARFLLSAMSADDPGAGASDPAGFAGACDK